MITPQPGSAVYAQLAGLLRTDIQTGRLQPGQRLPSEAHLQQQYGLARETVRRAVAILRTEGLVVVRHGHGVFVRPDTELQDLTLPAGATVTARMPTAEERARYDLGDGVPMLVVEGTGTGVQVYPADRWRLRVSPS